MPQFPKLNSGETTQYPFRRIVQCPVRTLTFLDGGEQRYAIARQGGRWVVDLALLTDDEAVRVDEFARQYFDTLEPFVFVDPADAREYAKCVLEGSEQQIRSLGEGKCVTRLIIAEELS